MSKWKKVVKHFQVLTACCGLIAVPGFAQKRTYSVQQAWLGYVQQAKLSDRWSILTDVHLRTRDHFTSKWFQAAARTGVAFRLSGGAILAGGYAYFHHYPGEGHAKAARPEHRGWQQVTWESGKRLKLQQRSRAEQRFRRKVAADSLAAGYAFNHRLRHAFTLQYPLWLQAGKAGPLAVVATEELMLNLGRQVVSSAFDQHRIFVGLGWQIHPDLFPFAHERKLLRRRSNWKI